MVRVLVVDDSPVARQLLTHILDSDPLIEVVGEATNGAQAVEMAATTSPDVITMDIQMPVLDGLEATRRIMEHQPKPIVLVSASFERSDVNRSFQALEAGALAIVQKPEGPSSPRFPEMSEELVTTVKLMAEVRLVTRRRREQPIAPSADVVLKTARSVELVCIGASTGGPAALAHLLGALPADLRAPIMVVQHITKGFEIGLVEWLNNSSKLHVCLAFSGQRLHPGLVVVGPQDKHLGVTARGRVLLTDADPIGGHRPSATYLYRSAARAFGQRAMGVILTGMGRDGAAGLVSMKEAGGIVVAQDEPSSVVYGMPREAVMLGVVDRVLPLTEIAEAIVEATSVAAE